MGSTDTDEFKAAQRNAREARVEITRARPVVLVQVSGGIAYAEVVVGDAEVYVVDWDNIEGETKEESEDTYSASANARDVMANPNIPDLVAEDLRISYERARRFDDL